MQFAIIEDVLGEMPAQRTLHGVHPVAQLEPMSPIFSPSVKATRTRASHAHSLCCLPCRPSVTLALQPERACLTEYEEVDFLIAA